MNHRAIPPQLLKETETSQRTKKQSTLDGVINKLPPPIQFTQDGLLEPVAKFIALTTRSVVYSAKFFKVL